MIKIILRALISLSFIALLFYLMRDDIPRIALALKNIHRPLFIISVGIAILTNVIVARRLQLIFGASDIFMKFSDAFNLTFVGFFFNNFLPTSVGGDIVKALCASRVTGQAVKSVTSILMDRIFGLFSFVLIPSLSLLFILRQITNPIVPSLVYSFLALSLFFFILLFNRGAARRFQFIEEMLKTFHLAEKTRKIYDSLHNFKNHKGVMLQAILLSFLAQGLGIFVMYLVVISLGAQTRLIYFYLIIPVVQLLSMLPSLNGLGIREGAFVYFLSPYIGKETAAALGILWLGVLLLMSVIGGVIYLLRQDYHVRFTKAVSEEAG